MNWNIIKHIFFSLTVVLLVAAPAPAVDHYVSPAGTNNPPYTNWADAATNIQWAVNAATNGETVLVSNGTYYLTNQVDIAAAITCASVNGREVTIVDGNNYGGKPVTNRCFYITAAATLDGFTIRNGVSTNSGGGVFCSTGTKVQNCRITSCVVSNPNASAILRGGGIYKGVVSNCEISANVNYNRWGGGMYLTSGDKAVKCIVVSNTIPLVSDENHGGGICAGATAIIDDCIVSWNQAKTPSYGGGVDCGAGGTILRNSLICNNSAISGGGVDVYYCWATIQNCTIASNTGTYGGGIFSVCSYPQTTYVENVVVYYNTAASGSNIYVSVPGYAGLGTGSYNIVNSCIASTNAFPTNLVAGYYYAGNIESNPQFVDFAGGNYRLNANSPCVNAGSNEDWMVNSVDLDGMQRIRYGAVDMGAYEAIYNGTIYKFGP